jgi:hypothetical protein
LDLLRHLITGLAALLAAPAIAPAAQAAPDSGPSREPGREARGPADRPPPSYYIILKSPEDWSGLMEKIRQPDLEVRRVDGPLRAAAGDPTGIPAASPPAVVESVRVRGRVAEDLATLTVELAIAATTDEPARVPIRLDGQKGLIGAREGGRALVLRMGERDQWEVELAGRGRHRIEVELRVPVTARPARKALSLAIPEAAVTSLELDFSHHESDIILGANENFGQSDLPGGQGTRLTAHLEPRSRIDVSWTDGADSGGRNPPLLTAHGEIALDVDAEQVRTRSSWAIRCVRGMTRTLEIRLDDADDVTELRLDDQPTEAGIEGARGAGRLTIRLGEPLRPDPEAPPRRLVMKTRRPLPKAAGRPIIFAGFPFTDAREQSGFIGVTQSANLWVSPTAAQGLRRIDPGALPTDLRQRPSTRLAFEFPDQPFRLHLEVEPSPPLVRARSRTAWRIEAEEAHSVATIELECVRGRLFEVGLALGPGLQLVSVGPPEVVEGSSWAAEATARNPAEAGRAARQLQIGLTPGVRDQKKVTLRLEGRQRVPRDGPVHLGLFTPEEATAVDASFVLSAEPSLSLELDDDSGRITRPGDSGSPLRGAAAEGPAAAATRGEMGPPALWLASTSNPRSLPIRMTRHTRALAQETLLSVQVSRRAIDLLQRTTFTVRFGTLGALEARVPASLADRWELLGREIVNREELVQEPDGTRRFRLSFDRPVIDRVTLRFRCRVPIAPPLDSAGPRDLAVPALSFPGVAAGPTRVELATAPELVFRGSDPGWVRDHDEVQAERTDEAAALTFIEGPGGRGRPFAFQAMAMEPAPLPSLVAPRLLIQSVQGFDEMIRSRAWYWVETHGPIFPFALPPGARWVAARVDGRASEQVEHDPTRAGYRLRFPADVGSRPALVELEYQLSGADAGTRWQPPRLLEGAVVLETLWDVRLPFERTLIGVPPGWSDENQWYWDGNLWKRRPGRGAAALNEWIRAAGTTTGALETLPEMSLGDSHGFLFSRTGPPAVLALWIVSRAWSVATCSGAALILGFFIIFGRLRFRTIWVLIAGLALLAAATVQPSVTWFGLQSAFIGVALTLLGLLIQRLLERTRSPAVPGRDPSSITVQPASDSALNRPAGVGSDDSTAIRVRVPSTMDFVPSHVAGPPTRDEARGSTLERD